MMCAATTDTLRSHTQSQKSRIPSPSPTALYSTSDDERIPSGIPEQLRYLHSSPKYTTEHVSQVSFPLSFTKSHLSGIFRTETYNISKHSRQESCYSCLAVVTVIETHFLDRDPTTVKDSLLIFRSHAVAIGRLPSNARMRTLIFMTSVRHRTVAEERQDSLFNIQKIHVPVIYLIFMS